MTYVTTFKNKNNLRESTFKPNLPQHSFKKNFIFYSLLPSNTAEPRYRKEK